MTRRTIKVPIGDPRVVRLVRIGAGEGFATFLGTFEGKPAFIADSGTLVDLLDPIEDRDLIETAVHVEVFDSVEARDRYVQELRETKPLALGTEASRTRSTSRRG
ncbi:MAG: hypothetical protein WBE98_15415 [Gammaproteobacteria bacterium]